MASPEEVLDFWFEDACTSPRQAKERNSVWFSADASTDKQIWTLFADMVLDAAAGHYSYWDQTALGRLALIILLDQFPRNIFRGTSEAFRYDASALVYAREGVEKGQLAGLAVPQQVFFLMPYQHSEELDAQRASVELMRGMVDEAPEEWRACASGHSDFARLHHDIVASYGRFPHRNALLGRTSTEAESAYLAGGGQTFGQTD